MPFTADDLAQSVFPDMVVELQALDTFTGFAKGIRKPQNKSKSQPSVQEPVAPPPGLIDYCHTYTYICMYIYIYIYMYIYV